jgi:hypothetical protein
MYVMVLHSISEPAAFWNAADPRNNLPPNVKLHHTFPTADGTRAVCIWEADSIDAVRNFLESQFGPISRNEYLTVENKEGFARPSRVPETAGAPNR